MMNHSTDSSMLQGEEPVLYPLSESQKSIWYLEKAYPGTSLNVVAGSLRFKNGFDYAAFGKAINLFIKKNDAFRIRLRETDGVAWQYISDYKEHTWEFYDFSTKKGLDDLFAWDEEQTRKPFDIIDNDLFYFALFKVSENEGGAYVRMHHLISDAWSMGLLVRQLVAFYTMIKDGLPVDETPGPSFTEHLASNSAYEKSRRFEADKQYWNKKFETLPEMTVLKPQKANIESINARRKTLITPLKLSNKIREFCGANQVSVFTLFMSALSIYINRVTGLEDIVLGTTILNRTNTREKETFGMFVSVAAPVRISISDTMDFVTFSKAMLRENTDILRHQKYPYNYLLRDLKKTHKQANRLFDIVLNYQNAKFQKNESREDYTARWHFSGRQVESLVISINDREDGGNLIIDYDFLTDVFDIKEVEFIHQHIISLLWHALDNPTKKISKLDMISEKEKHTLLHEFSDTFADYPRDKTLHWLFEQQAMKTPDNTALVFDGQKLSYAELNNKANRLAHRLRELGVGRDKVVGIMTRRSIEMMVGIMGILKAGGAYMPIDPDYPAERIGYMLKNSCTGLLLTRRELMPDNLDFAGQILELDADSSYTSDISDPPAVNAPKDLAYVIYTSGSTGRPKGVMIEHTGVVNRICWMLKKYPFNENSVILQKTTYTFDVSVWELFSWFFIGASCCLLKPGDEKDPEAIISAVEKNGITAMHFVPSMLSAFLNYVDTRGYGFKLKSLVNVFASGEALSVQQAHSFNRLLYETNGTTLSNLYGPTEATVEVSYFECSPMPALPSVPIGKPIDNISLYIFDKNHNLLPVGIPGELYIGGVGVARGYLNNPELTSERFVVNPYKRNEILYKTGDRARWYPKGDIEFLGRADYQVKVRGFRIELGEIEARLMSHASVQEAVVKPFADENGVSYLTAYIVSSGGADEHAIRDYLSGLLPEYMVPSSYVFLDKMPLNSNGKADRNALAKPELLLTSREYAPPSNEREALLAEIWQRVLGLGRVGVLDEYTALGGDSLNAIKIITEIHKAFGLALSPRSVFLAQTIRKLAAQIAAAEGQEGVEPHIPKVPDGAYYEVSAAQKRQYLLNKIDKTISYNLPGCMVIDGALDKELFASVLETLLERHEALRTSFGWKDGRPVQIVHDRVEADFAYSVADGAGCEDLMASFIRPFDLERAPLFRARLVRVSENRHLLLFDMHHIISDGASVNIILGEIADLLSGGRLSEPAVQYKDYSAWHNHRLQSDEMKAHEAYWLAKYAGVIPVLDMPLDFARPAVQSFRGARVAFSVSEKLTEQIKDLAARTGTTLFMVLFSAYNVLLSRYTGREDIVVGTPVEGRFHSDLNSVVGMFVNTLALRTRPDGEKSFAAYLREVKEELLGALEHQEYPFEELVEKTGIKRDMSRNPLFDVMFSLQNMKLNRFSAGGLDLEPSVYFNGTAKFDLTLEALDRGGTIACTFEFCADLFRDETIRRMSGHFLNILSDLAVNPDRKLHELTILSDAERRRLLADFNDTDADYPHDKTLHQIFEAQAAKTPDNIALLFSGATMTYRTLNEKANRLARTLRAKGVGPDVVVGLMTYRSFEMVTGILAILKAGGAYLPIDPDYPAERKNYLLESSRADILLTQHRFINSLPADPSIIDLDDEKSYDENGSDLPHVNSPADLAYVIYTSGSTGNPKGVMVEHTSVVNRIQWMVSRYPFGPESIILQKTTYCFDVSVWELFAWFFSGSALCLLGPGEEKDPAAIIGIIEDKKVTLMHFVPSMLSVFLEYVESRNLSDKLASLVNVFASGEALTLRQTRLFNELLYDKNGTRLTNMYGPTEATVEVSYFECSPMPPMTSVPIGRPISNLKLYVLDRFDQLQPVGIPGELFIGGVGVARGYLHNPDLTNEKFIHHAIGGRLYKTGDIAKVLESGDIDYLGRVDNQVKIRGMRLELGEIENSILKIKGIEQAVVAARETGGDKRLYAYYKSQEAFEPKDLVARLSGMLPDYMVPAAFIRLDAMPLSSNGKIDRKALPEPEGRLHRDTYMAPESNLERAVADLWAKVLHIKDVGVYDSFFDLGGNSLNAVSLTTLLHQQLQVEIAPRDIFRYPTLRGLCAYIEALPKQDYTPIPKVPEGETHPLSSAQKRQHILNLIEGDGLSYNISGGLLLDGNLDKEKTEKAFKTMIARHESLRTSFGIRDGEPVQIIHSDVEFHLEYSETVSTDLNGLIKAFVRPFDLSAAPLFRAGLVRLPGDKHLLMYDMHHIISDGASVNVLLDEIAALYNDNTLPELTIQYKDYAAWHNELLASEKIKKQEAYWLERFSGEIPVLNIPCDFARPAVRSFKGARVEFSIDGALSAEIKKMNNNTGTTLFMSMLAAYNALLYRYTGQQDIIVGTVVEGRRHADLTQLIGMFVNTLAIRNYPGGEKTFKEFLDETREDLLNAFSNQDYPYEALVDKAGIRRDLSRNPLFDTMFILENIELSKLSAGDFKAAPFLFDNGTSKFDLTLEAVDKGETIACTFEYSTDLFAEETIRRMAGHFINILRDAAANPDKKLRELHMLSEEERRQLLNEFNDTDADYPRDKTIHQLFEEQAARAPDQTALIFKEEKMTYRELNEKANRLARTLRAKGVGPDVVVGLMTYRSYEMLVGILAILKAGGAYLPIDPDYPAERKSYLLESSRTGILLTQHAQIDTLPAGQTIINLDDESSYAEDSSNLPAVNKPTDLIYVIYTSGSTGNPKGVMVEHTSVVNRIQWMIERYPFGADSVIMQKTTYCFDVSVWELFAWFFTGAALCLLGPGEEKDPGAIIKTIEDQKVTFMHFVPSMLGVFLEYVDSRNITDKLASLVNVFASGEALTLHQTQLFNKLLYETNGTRLSNMYGPTEATVEVSYFDCSPMPPMTTVPIGKPISNIRLYVLDQHHGLLPVGVPGELFIGGVGVARGYLHNPALTADRFVQSSVGGRMYKTGDIARVLSSGMIEYLGRADNQVKIRGIRIELGEIEYALTKYVGIEEAVVIAREIGGGKQLCAFYTSPRELDPKALSSFLSGKLPDYMIPSFFIRLEAMPLSSNGKTDRKALPEPTGPVRSDAFVAPETETEITVAGIWTTILGVNQIGADDSFFELGGSSLTAVSAVSLIHKQLDVEIAPRDMFIHQTLRGLSVFIEKQPKKSYAPIPKVMRSHSYQLSSAQKRQFILKLIEGDGISYNVPGGLILTGNVDREKLEKAFTSIVARHESLRTSFEVQDGVPLQIIHEHVDYRLEYAESTGTSPEGLMKAFIRPFDLGVAPLFRTKLVKLPEGRFLLLYDMHHIITDGASISILLDEFIRLYDEQTLPELRVQYKDYAAWHNTLLNSKVIKKQEAYWLDKFTGELPVLNMPTDFARPSVRSSKGKSYTYIIDEVLTDRIKGLCARTGATLYMLLLSAFNVLLYRYSGQEDVIVGTPAEGRRHADLSHLIGMFVNTLALRTYPSGDKTFAGYLEEVKAAILGALEHQEYPFEELVDRIGVRRDASRNPLFDVMFVLENVNLAMLAGMDFTAELCPFDSRTAKFDLAQTIIDKGTVLECTLEYNTDLFRDETIHRMAGHFVNLLQDITASQDKKLHELNMLSEEERRRLLYEFNDTAADYPRDKTIHQLFEEQTARTPDKTALIFKEEKMTYRELNEKANRLARTLRAKGVGPDVVVGIITYRSFEMMVGILGILKAGGAYLPIDPDYPLDRINYLLETSRADILLMKRQLIKPHYNNKFIIDLDDESSYDRDGTNLSSVNQPGDLTYVIYTSGSTGNPKGVMIEHTSAINRINWMVQKYAFDENSVIMQKTTYCFDVSVWELFGWFFVGASLCLIASGEEKDPEVMIRNIKKHKVTIMHFVPSMLSVFLEYVESKKLERELAALKNVFASGEALQLKQVKLFNKLLYVTNGTQLSNLYGPTEAAVDVSYFDCSPMMECSSVPIGKPIDNIKLYVFDKYRNLQAVGIPGELYIGGVGVARGYLHNPELTNEKFIQNPIGRLYKTGDIAKILETGDIEYLGRADNQVKIRGMRIELGEIENALMKHPDIGEAVVSVHEAPGGTKKLCAYIRSEAPFSATEVNTYLEGILPRYMIPSYIVKADAFPLNRNGKIDRAALPKPSEIRADIVENSKPRNLTEEIIANVWAEVLHLSAVGIHDNYFDIGGDSLSAVKIITKLNLGISITDIYTYPTIRQLAERLESEQQKTRYLINMTTKPEPENCSVVCFPYGGGGSFSYRDISNAADRKNASLNIFGVNLPGHDYGMQSKLESFEVMAEQLAEEIHSSITGELILYGHCSGSALMLAVMRRLTELNIKIKAVFVGAAFVPKFNKLTSLLNKNRNPYSTRYVLNYLKQAGVSEDVLANKDYVEFMRNVLWHDRMCFETYFRKADASKLTKSSIPMYNCIGDKDSSTRNFKIMYGSWHKYFEKVQLVLLRDAGHFFMNSHHEELVELFQSL